MTRSHLHVIDSADGEIVGGIWPLLPDGEYLATFTGHETKRVFREARVFCHFTICDPGPYHGAKLFRAFRARSLIGKEGRGGRFAVGTRSDLFLMLCRILDLKVRPDRITLRPLHGLLLKVQTRTVTKDYRQQELPQILHYSVIDQVLEIEAGGVAQ